MAPAPIFRTRLEEVALGMVLLGVIFSSILYGIMLTQTYKYYQRFKRDARSIKLLVFAVLVLNTASVFLVGHAAWYYLVTTGKGYLSIWSLNVELALSMLMSGLSETFLAIRVYRLSGNKIWLTAILLLLAFVHFGSGEVAAIKLLLLKKSARLTSEKVPSIIRLASAAVCDTAIASALSYFLHTKRTGFKKNDEAINYLILFSINSGLLTSATSIASLITYVVVPRTWVYTALCFLISRLYATTFLCSLNSRQILYHDEINTDSEKETTITKIKHPFRRSNWSVKRTSGGNTPSSIDIFVITETISDGPRPPTSAKIRNSNTHLKEVAESPASTLSGTFSSESHSSCH
jgi:hypothetical protein